MDVTLVNVLSRSLRMIVLQTAKRTLKLLITSTTIAELKLELSIDSSKNLGQDLFQRQKNLSCFIFSPFSQVVVPIK